MVDLELYFVPVEYVYLIELELYGEVEQNLL